MRPRLPDADALLPYLRRIDSARVYSNWGPLVSELEARLASHFRLPRTALTIANTGTSALVAAILARAGRGSEGKPIAISPAYTFPATAAAIELCGYRPFLADIDPNTWALGPKRLAQLDESILQQTGVVVVVAPYGRSFDQESWLRFQKQRQIPVVIDGAASFEFAERSPEQIIGEIPVVMSFHATKSFATGEGGCVVSSDTNLVADCVRALNFGFSGSRESLSASTNGKMSEYHAAVGLAELDGWSRKKELFLDVATRYRQRFAHAKLEDNFTCGPDLGSNYAIFRCASAAQAQRVQACLESVGSEYRHWYGLGLHQHRYYAELPREPLAVTDGLAPCLLGLPMAMDLAEDQIEVIVAAVARGCSQ
jgi:dTDP-4-amino-4,6-dideoxygalactose transaminase